MDRRPVRLEIPTSTIAKLLATALLVLAAWQLWPLLLMFLLGTLVAVTLYPIPVWLMRHGVSRSLSIALLSLGMLAAIAGAFYLLAPPLYEQIGGLIKNFPKYQEQLVALLPKQSFAERAMRNMLHYITVPNPANWVKPLATIGGLAVGGIAQIAIVLVFAVYLVADGPRAWTWIVAFFEKNTRARLGRTAREVRPVVFAYMTGQAITSLLCSVFAFGVLYAFKVPAALTLGIVAGIFDILPILGFFLFTIPATLLALTVSAKTALSVALIYGAYHLFENYVIVPKVYGNRLRVSTLAVLVALLAASATLGIMGAIAILPIVAAYPIVERIWLTEHLGAEVIERHEEQLNSDDKKSA